MVVWSIALEYLWGRPGKNTSMFSRRKCGTLTQKIVLSTLNSDMLHALMQSHSATSRNWGSACQTCKILETGCSLNSWSNFLMLQTWFRWYFGFGLVDVAWKSATLFPYSTVTAPPRGWTGSARSSAFGRRQNGWDKCFWLENTTLGCKANSSCQWPETRKTRKETTWSFSGCFPGIFRAFMRWTDGCRSAS